MKKLFIVLDAFLDKSQRTVQSCHAVAQWCQEHPDWLQEWNRPDAGHIVVKKAKDLEAWLPQVDSCFREPYWDNRLTALVAYREEGFAPELPLA